MGRRKIESGWFGVVSVNQFLKRGSIGFIVIKGRLGAEEREESYCLMSSKL